jgi:hypothetical protein
MNKDIAILNLTGIYNQESFYLHDKSSRFVDLSDIFGTNCMCDEMAVKEILERLQGAGGDDISRGIHFIDNGNYHYMSALFLSQVKEPFSLVVLDNHPDMQQPMFDILSCGGWVLDVIQKNPYVRDVHIIGARQDLVKELPEEVRKMATFYDSAELPQTQYPLYLSIDKDVMTRDEIVTNWDQGCMGKRELFCLVKDLLARESGSGGHGIIGVDICGECAPEQEDCDLDAAIRGNDEFNAEMLELLAEFLT